MKLPRWLVVSMLAASSLAMFMFAAWWWVTWPERTLERFLEYGRAGKWDKANGMCDDKVWVNVASIDDKTRDECCEFFAALRSLGANDTTFIDILLGRRRFKLKFADGNPFSVGVTRGRIDLTEAM